MCAANSSLSKHAQVCNTRVFDLGITVCDFGSTNHSPSCQRSQSSPSSQRRPFKPSAPQLVMSPRKAAQQSPQRRSDARTPQVKLETEKYNSKSHEISVIHTRQTAEKERLLKLETVCLMLLYLRANMHNATSITMTCTLFIYRSSQG